MRHSINGINVNTFSLVLVMPTLLTLGSAGTLYFSFKGRVDTSGRYFLLAEFLMLLVLLLVIATNIEPSLATPAVFFVSNVFALISEVAIFLSIIALTQRIKLRKFIYLGAITVLCCGLIEYSRKYIDLKAPILILPFYSIILTMATYRACRAIKSNGLKSNIFINSIAYLELGLTAIHALRFASFFSDTPMVPREPTAPHMLIFSTYLTLNIFRYISYQSLRISWIDPRDNSDNSLNRDLVKLVKEKNQFLQGLISSNRALGISALANSLAHQLSQPITGVILQAESVKRDLIKQGGQEKSVGILKTVSDQLEKLFELVSNLRRLFGTKEEGFISFRLQEACDEALEIIIPTLKSKNILLVKRYESDPIAFGNPIQIQQVLINLFNNAMDAIKNSANQTQEITLMVSHDSEFACIKVQDTGTGINPDDASFIFDLYHSSKLDGLGIGLWLSKTIIDNHEGKIIASNSPQGGAIFEVYIPPPHNLNKPR